LEIGWRFLHLLARTRPDPAGEALHEGEKLTNDVQAIVMTVPRPSPKTRPFLPDWF
jgi:hypothetical protein